MKHFFALSQQILLQKVFVVTLCQECFFISCLLGGCPESLLLTCEGKHTLCDMSFLALKVCAHNSLFLHGSSRWWTPLEFPPNILMSCTISSWNRKKTGLCRVFPLFILSSTWKRSAWFAINLNYHNCWMNDVWFKPYLPCSLHCWPKYHKKWKTFEIGGMCVIFFSRKLKKINQIIFFSHVEVFHQYQCHLLTEMAHFVSK